KRIASSQCREIVQRGPPLRAAWDFGRRSLFDVRRSGCHASVYHRAMEGTTRVGRMRRGRDPMEEPYAFLSYCHDNRAEALRLHDDLVVNGINVWWDNLLLPGQNWELEISRALSSCSAVVACLSNEFEARATSGMHPELRDSIESLRSRPPGSVFLIPVR